MFPNTKICDLLDIQYPIILGGMAWVGDAALASAVSNAGGLGVLSGGSLSPEVLQQEIRKTKQLTSKPFGVNLIMWETFFKDQLEVIIEEKIGVITTGVGDPRLMMKRIKGHDIIVIPVVPTARHAKRMEEAGVHAVVASGCEAGGHVGNISTLVTVQKTVQTVKIPVIAAGGICDARGMVAALALGACGIQMGTRFIVSPECNAHINYKQIIIDSNEEETTVTGEYTGSLIRVIRNAFADEWTNSEKEKVDKDELRRRGVGRFRMVVYDGNIDDGSLTAGQVIGLINEQKSVKEIIEETINGSITIMRQLGKEAGLLM